MWHCNCKLCKKQASFSIKQTVRETETKYTIMGWELRLQAIFFLFPFFSKLSLINKYYFYMTGLGMLALSFNCFGLLFFHTSFSRDLWGPKGDRRWRQERRGTWVPEDEHWNFVAALNNLHSFDQIF